MSAGSPEVPLDRAVTDEIDAMGPASAIEPDGVHLIDPDPAYPAIPPITLPATG